MANAAIVIAGVLLIAVTLIGLELIAVPWWLTITAGLSVLVALIVMAA